MHEGVTIEEARWLEEESARHSSDEETPREEALEWCRRLVGRYGGADQLADLPLEDAGPCTDCTATIDVRYRIGPAVVCRHDAISRLRARRHTDEPNLANAIRGERAPDDLELWISFAAADPDITERGIRASLRLWNVDDDTTVRLVDLYADKRAIHRANALTDEILLQPLDTLPSIRCDTCNRRGPVYLVGDQALCRDDAITVLRTPTSEAA